MQSTHMQAHTDSNKANNETSTDQHADRCMQTLIECTAAVRDRDRRSSGAAVQRSTCDLLDARSVASHDQDDRPRMFLWPHTQTLDYHCRHSMAISGDGPFRSCLMIDLGCETGGSNKFVSVSVYCLWQKTKTVFFRLKHALITATCWCLLFFFSKGTIRLKTLTVFAFHIVFFLCSFPSVFVNSSYSHPHCKFQTDMTKLFLLYWCHWRIPICQVPKITDVGIFTLLSVSCVTPDDPSWAMKPSE